MMSFFKNRVKSIAAVLLSVLLVTLCSCTTKQEKAICELLCGAEWINNDGIGISFESGGDFAVSGGRLWDGRYYYNGADGVLTFRCGEESADCKLLFCDENYLCINYSGQTSIFKNADSQIDDSILPSAQQYFKSGDSLLFYVLSYENGLLYVAPYDYDRDTDELFEYQKYSLNASENISFSSVTVTVDNGKETVEHFVLDEEESKYVGEYYCGGFAYFDSNGNVSDIVFYGVTEIWG